MNIRSFLHILGLCLLLAACGVAEPRSEPVPAGAPADAIAPNVAPISSLVEGSGSQAPQSGDEAPDFSYSLADGTTVLLSDLRGRKVLLNFWATWCYPCREEMPAFQDALAAHGADELAIVAVSIEESALIDAFGRELGLSFPLISNQSGDISQRYGVSGLPTSFFIDRDGIVATRHLGALDQAEIDEILASIP